MSRKCILVHSNSCRKKLSFPSFSIFDFACSRINGFSFDFHFDFLLYSFHSCWPLQTPLRSDSQGLWVTSQKDWRSGQHQVTDFPQRRSSKLAWDYGPWGWDRWPWDSQSHKILIWGILRSYFKSRPSSF